jgi:hypothetical protein
VQGYIRTQSLRSVAIMSSHHIPRPTTNEILRYRFQHGINLGSVYVLEQWLSPKMYDHGVSGASELDAVVA